MYNVQYLIKVVFSDYMKDFSVFFWWRFVITMSVLIGTLSISGVLAAENTYVCIPSDNEYFQKYQSYKEKFNGNFLDAFDALKKEYHSDMNDRFNEAIADTSFSVYVGKKVDIKACTPVHYSKGNTSLVEFQTQMRQELRKYECALSAIQGDASISAEGISFEKGIGSLQAQEYVVLDEISKSKATLNFALQNYAEMRQWYPVHRDLECLISQMEKYRNALRGFVDRVVVMPAKYYNYSSRYQ